MVMSQKEAIKLRLRSTSCSPLPIECLYDFEYRKENGFFLNPIFCFAPDKAQINPELEYRCKLMIVSYFS